MNILLRRFSKAYKTHRNIKVGYFTGFLEQLIEDCYILLRVFILLQKHLYFLLVLVLISRHNYSS